MTADVGVPTVRRPLAPVWLWVSLLIVAAPLAGTALGETPIPLSTVWQALANQMLGAGYPLDPIDQGIVWAYRLPRALVAGACGAGYRGTSSTSCPGTASCSVAGPRVGARVRSGPPC